MNPETYAKLYSPWRPPPNPGPPLLNLAVSALWILISASVAWVGFLVVLSMVLGAAGTSWSELGRFALPYVLGFCLGAGLLLALAFASPLRRLSYSARMLVLGLLASPVPVVIVMWTAVSFG